MFRPLVKTLFLLLALQLALAGVACAQMLPGTEPIPGLMADSTGAPLKLDFSIPMEGITDPGLLLKNYAQQPLLLLYFSPKCPHCRQDFPDVQKLAREYQGYVQTIAVSVKSVSKRDIQGFVDNFNEKQIQFFQDTESKFGSLYGDGYVPRMYLVNSDGTLIRYTDFSAQGLQMIRDEINQRYKK